MRHAYRLAWGLGLLGATCIATSIGLTALAAHLVVKALERRAPRA